MDWHWLVTIILIPASVALWGWGKSLLARSVESRIKRQEAQASAYLEGQRDERESRQRREEMELAQALGNQSFKDEQLTAMAAEAQTEAGEANEFIRGQYDKLAGQMVTQAELKENTSRLEALEKRVTTIDTYLRSIIQELRDDRRRQEKQESTEYFEIVISGLRDELAALKAQVGHKGE